MPAASQEKNLRGVFFIFCIPVWKSRPDYKVFASYPAISSVKIKTKNQSQFWLWF